MRIAICDDEGEIQQLLGEKVKQSLPNAEIWKFDSGEAFLASGCQPDILFLDIQMPGINGMETANRIRNGNGDCIIIFVTALEEYVYDAFDVGAFHYLVKPIEDEKFSKVLEKAVAQIRREKTQENDNPCLVIKHRGITRKICIQDIVYAEVFNRIVVIHLENETVEYYGRLKDIESLTTNTFFRTHRAYLVNLGYVTGYEAGKVYMKDDSALLSKQNYPEFVKAFLQYHRRNKEL